MEEALRQQPSWCHTPPVRPTAAVLSVRITFALPPPGKKGTSFSPSSIPREQSRMGALDSQQKSKK
jgi:hypothetical protein